jgi:hypothetical protein
MYFVVFLDKMINKLGDITLPFTQWRNENGASVEEVVKVFDNQAFFQ